MILQALQFVIIKTCQRFGIISIVNHAMESHLCSTSIFTELPELARLGFLIGLDEDSTRFPSRVILDRGGKITWDKHGLYMMISMEQLIWTLVLLRRYATDMESAFHAREDPLNTALKLMSSPQTFILSSGTSEFTGMQLNAEHAISSGGEARIIFVAKRMTARLANQESAN